MIYMRGGGGADFTCLSVGSMCFKIMSKVVKYTCRLRRYNYTQDQLNTRHFNDFIIIFLGIFLRGGTKLKFANAIFMQNMIKTHQLEHVLKKSVGRCIAIINMLYNK